MADEAQGAAIIDEALENDPAIAMETPKDAAEVEEIALAAAKASEVKMVPVSLIEKSEVSLRDVSRQTESYQLLVNSVRKKGVLNSILVRSVEAPGGVQKYGLIDGLQRFSAACDAGLDFVPARVVEMDDAELLEAQIITNMNRVQTKPADLSKHLLRILARNPFMTKQQLAERTCQSLTWVEQRLSINRLKTEIQELVNNGKIHLTNAYALSKIPEEEQAQHVDAAMTESPKTFVPRMKNRVKEIKDAKHSGKDAGKAEFQPVQHLQKVGDVKKEYAALHQGEGDSRVLALIKKHKITDPLEAVKICVAWLLNFDPESQEEQKRKNKVKEEKRKERTAQLKAEREAKKEEEAAERAADITVGF